MTDRYERIRRALAMGPTPGPWKAHDPSESGWVSITNAPYATPLCYAVPYSEPLDDPRHDFKRWGSRAHKTPANAAHILACDPDTIRALLEERDELVKLVMEMRGTLRDLRIHLHAAGRRPEECYEMSMIDDALDRAAIDAAMEGEK